MHTVMPASTATLLASSPYLFGWAERWTIAAVAFTLHSASLLYLICFAFFYFVISAENAVILQLFAPKVQSVAFVLVALLHLHGLSRVVFPRCFGTALVKFYLDDIPTSLVGRVVHLYRKYFSRYGVFGLHGSLYEMRVTFKQIVQVPAQAYQAYQMSVYLTNPALCALYTTLLACDCLFVPCFLFSKHEFTRRWGPGFVDALFDFTLSAGFPLAIIFHAFVDYFVAGNDALVWNKTWLNQMIMMARFVSVTNVVDMLSTLLPFVTCYVSLTALYSAVQLRMGDMAMHESSMRRAAELVTVRVKNVNVLLRICRRAFLFVSAVAGIFLCTMAGTSVTRQSCAPGCRLQTFPWFTKQCNCVMMRQNCVLHPIANDDVDAFVLNHVANAFDIALVQCNLPHGLSQQTLHSLTNLYSLSLRLTNTVEWKLEPTDLPPSLTMLYFQDQVVPRLPNILDRNVNKLRYMFLRNITITGDEGVTAMSVYKNLTMLSLTNMSLTVVPLNVLDQVGLTQFEFSYNRLVSFPDQLLALQNLQTLSLEFNLISSIPSAFVRQFPSSLKTIYLDGNPLLALPLDTDFALIQSQRLRIRGTPMCDRLYAAARSIKSPRCHPWSNRSSGS